MLSHTKLFIIIFIIAISACSHPKKSTTLEKTIADSDPSHNSENSLDWEGVYHALLPCTGCSGVDTWLSLHQAGNRNFYEFIEIYRGNSDSIFSSQGEFTWSKKGDSIVFTTNGKDFFFEVFEDQLQMLNSKNQPFTNPDLYRLTLLNEYKHNGARLLIHPNMIKQNAKMVSFSGIVNLEHPAADKHLSSKLTAVIDCTSKTSQLLTNRRFKQRYAAGKKVDDPTDIKGSEYQSKINGLIEQISNDYCKK